MLFFKVDWVSTDEEPKVRKSTEDREEIKRIIIEQVLDFNEDLPEGIDIYLSRKSPSEAVFHVVLENDAMIDDIEHYVGQLVETLSWHGDIISMKEVTIGAFGRMVRTSSYIEEANDVLAKYGIEDISMSLARHGTELLISESKDKESSMALCRELLCENTVLPEIRRIFDPNAPKKFTAHPVQYIIMSDSASVRKSIRELLLSSLWEAGRLQSRRVYLSLGSNVTRMRRRFFEPLKFEYLEKLYDAQRGGAIVLPFAGAQGDEDGNTKTANSDMNRIQDMLPLIREFRHDVLSIIEIGRKDESLYRMICRELAGVVMVKLDESVVFRQEAEDYLKRSAAKDNISDVQSLLQELPETDEGFVLTDLQNIYDRWFDGYLHHTIYPSYRDFRMLGETTVAEEPKGAAYQELISLIGLKEAKATIKQMLDYHRAHNIFSAHGRSIGKKPSMHMVFMGNPGTAKTTVARLVARIMKDNGVIPVGNLIEVGRQDVVDRYVGGTAPKVKSLFSRAKGSVLFIDEAYSLVDGKRGMYGDEAISAIVQEMENHREDTVVIFAGYPSEMEKLLDTNPGLRSRIAFRVNFEDYSKEELVEMVEKFAKDDNMKLSEEAREKLATVIEIRVRECLNALASGNGRLARNLYEKIRMRQATRIVNTAPDMITDKMLGELTAEDLDIEPEKKTGSEGIGFRCH